MTSRGPRHVDRRDLEDPDRLKASWNCSDLGQSPRALGVSSLDRGQSLPHQQATSRASSQRGIVRSSSHDCATRGALIIIACFSRNDQTPNHQYSSGTAGLVVGRAGYRANWITFASAKMYKQIQIARVILRREDILPSVGSARKRLVGADWFPFRLSSDATSLQPGGAELLSGNCSWGVPGRYLGRGVFTRPAKARSIYHDSATWTNAKVGQEPSSPLPGAAMYADPVDESLRQVPFLIKMFIIIALERRFFWRDHRLLPLPFDRRHRLPSVISIGYRVGIATRSQCLAPECHGPQRQSGRQPGFTDVRLTGCTLGRETEPRRPNWSSPRREARSRTSSVELRYHRTGRIGRASIRVAIS